MIAVESRVNVYEVNGSEPHPGGPEVQLKVCSHWNRSEFVVLELHGTRVTVSARDIQAAVANATHVAKW